MGEVCTYVAYTTSYSTYMYYSTYRYLQGPKSNGRGAKEKPSRFSDRMKFKSLFSEYSYAFDFWNASPPKWSWFSRGAPKWSWNQKRVLFARTPQTPRCTEVVVEFLRRSKIEKWWFRTLRSEKWNTRQTFMGTTAGRRSGTVLRIVVATVL